MFANSSVRKLNIDGWDTSKVVSMNSMFQRTPIDHLDISHLNTSACTNMGGMFWSAYPDEAIDKEIDVHYLNTSACTNMGGMFNGEYTKIDIRGFRHK